MYTKTQKPAIGIVYSGLCHGLPHTAYPKHVLQHRQLDERHRVKAWPTVILAVQWLHQLIYEAPVYGRFQFPNQMLLRYQVSSKLMISI
jgi:hypothetical protein